MDKTNNAQVTNLRQQGFKAIRSLKEDGIGKWYSNSLNNTSEYTFLFNESYTKKIENEILSDKNLTSQKDFNLKDEVIKRLNAVMDAKKNDLKEIYPKE